MRVQRTPGATRAAERRSSRERGPRGSSFVAADTGPANGSNHDRAAAAAAIAHVVRLRPVWGRFRTTWRRRGREPRADVYPTAFFTAASSSRAPKAPSMRAAIRPLASIVKTQGSVGRRNARSWGR
jgi:hypothetical protein